MTLQLADLFWLVAVGLALNYWWNAKGVKEIAYQACLRRCQELDLQLLDETLLLRGLWVKRNRQGKLRFWRAYQFEFSSTGTERYRGRIVILGATVERIDLEPHRLDS